MVSHQSRVADLRERIVDLPIKQMFHTAGDCLIETSAFDQRTERSAVAIGTDKYSPLLFEQQLSIQIRRGHHALTENFHILFAQPKKIVRLKKTGRLLMGWWAGHDVERNRSSKLP